jgi:signal transduction histidine kinase
MGDDGEQMKVSLVSEDKGLHELCRSVLRELGVNDLEFEAPDAKHSPADLRIWDLSTGVRADVVERVKAGEFGDIFVVSRKSLPEMQKLVPASAFAFLLKPVKRPVLRAFFSSALNSWSTADGDGEASRDGRTELLQALLEANLRLQENDQDRTNFLARALHDLRTPLTALQGYCDMLVQQRTGPLQPEQLEILQRMQHSVARLTKMSKAMFELSVQNNAESKPNLARTNIDNCVQNAVNTILPIADDRGISINLDLDPPDTHLYADAAAIEQVLVNLFENACKFTSRGGSIELVGRLSYAEAISDQRTNGHGGTKIIPVYRVEMQDTGVGIQPQHLSSVFEEYTSYSGARDRSGAGLGLAICKMLVEAHKGVIWADSNTAGTKITFTLPITQNEIGTQQLKTLEPQPLTMG